VDGAAAGAAAGAVAAGAVAADDAAGAPAAGAQREETTGAAAVGSPARSDDAARPTPPISPDVCMSPGEPWPDEPLPSRGGGAASEPGRPAVPDAGSQPPDEPSTQRLQPRVEAAHWDDPEIQALALTLPYP
jgi:hypothetical protein